MTIDRQGQVAEWMAENGGRVADCARALGLKRELVENCWYKIRRKLGWQAR